MKILLGSALVLLVAGLLVLAWQWIPDRSEAGRSPAAQVAADRILVALPDGSELRLPARPSRVLPANAAAVDFLLPLIEPERVVALPEAALDYSILTGTEHRWAELPRFERFVAEEMIFFATRD